MDSSPTALPLRPSSDLNKGKDRHARTVFDFSLLRKGTDIPKEFIWPSSERPHAVEELKAPVVDIQGFLRGDEPSTRQAAEIVRAACSTYGFFQVINHGIDPSLSHDAMSFLEEFFKIPSDSKLRIHRQPGSSWGYAGAHLDGTTSKLPWREFLCLGNNSVASDENGIADYFKSILGKDFEQMGWVYHRYFREVKELSLRILELLAISLGLDRECFREFFKDGELHVRCISYPPCQKPEEVLGVGPHCDPSALTVLQHDQVEGFEVFMEGRWQRVCPRPEALVINTGEIFMVIFSSSSSSSSSSSFSSSFLRGGVVWMLAWWWQASGQKVTPITKLTQELPLLPLLLLCLLLLLLGRGGVCHPFTSFVMICSCFGGLALFFDLHADNSS